MPNDPGEVPPGTPRWVKVSAIVTLVLVLLLVVVMVIGGDHGPGRHLGGDDAPAAGQDHEPPAWVPEH